MDGNVMVLTAANLNSVLVAESFTFVDVFAPWWYVFDISDSFFSGPCKQFAPVLKKVATALSTSGLNVGVGHLNGDAKANHAVMVAYKIT